MSIYIVDASVAAKWFLDELHTESARRLLYMPAQLHAPDFFLLEMDNLFCKRIRRGDFSEEDGNNSRLILRSHHIYIHPFGDFLDEAYSIANQTGRSLYDCLYVALAVHLDGKMVTADRKLYDGLAEGPFVRYVAWIKDIG